MTLSLTPAMKPVSRPPKLMVPPIVEPTCEPPADEALAPCASALRSTIVVVAPSWLTPNSSPLRRCILVHVGVYQDLTQICQVCVTPASRVAPIAKALPRVRWSRAASASKQGQHHKRNEPLLAPSACGNAARCSRRQPARREIINTVTRVALCFDRLMKRKSSRLVSAHVS